MKQVSRALRVLVAIIAVAYPVLYLVLAWYRISYPYELEWMEGATVDHVRRILSGMPLYVEPSMEFVPFIYTPLYYYVCAIVSMLLGPGFQALRLVSLLSSVGCFLVLFVFVKKETESAFAALLSLGFFAATYRLSGSWFDLARVDTLFLFLVLSSLLVLRFRRDVRGGILSGILISLAFLTKQTALPVAACMAVYCLLILPRWSKLIYPATVALLVGGSTLALNIASHGWYEYFVFSLPRQHAIVRGELTDFWVRDVGPLSIALVLSVVYLASLVFRRRPEGVFFICALAGMMGAAWLSRLHSGGYHNVLLPAHAVIALCFGPSAHALMRWKSVAGRLHEPILILVCMAQLVSLAYDPAPLLPTAADLKAGDELVELLGSVEGEVFVPYHGFLPALAGKKTHAHTMAISDVLRGRNEEVERNLRRNIEDELLGGDFDLIVLDTEWGSMQDAIESHYRLMDWALERDDVFWPVTGKKTRPELVYERPPSVRR